MIAAPWRRASCTAVLIWCSAGAAVHACPVCFQFDDPAASAGVEAAVLVLAGVTVSVLIPCAAFAVRLAGRDKPDPAASVEDPKP